MLSLSSPSMTIGPTYWHSWQRYSAPIEPPSDNKTSSEPHTIHLRIFIPLFTSTLFLDAEGVRTIPFS